MMIFRRVDGAVGRGMKGELVEEELVGSGLVGGELVGSIVVGGGQVGISIVAWPQPKTLVLFPSPEQRRYDLIEN